MLLAEAPSLLFGAVKTVKIKINTCASVRGLNPHQLDSVTMEFGRGRCAVAKLQMFITFTTS
jgi:hypothetical protein